MAPQGFRAYIAVMGFRIENRLGIPAAPHAVWEVLGDIELWGRWQSLYPSVKGILRIGSVLELQEQLPETEARALQATVIDWTPDILIHWGAKSSGGLIKRTRYFEIEKLTDTGCIFSNGEVYDGFMTRYVPRARRRAIRAGFEAFGEALKAEVARRA